MAEQPSTASASRSAQLRARVPSYIRWSFAATILFGLVAHGFAFTNDLLNHDDVYHLLWCDYGALSGRWLLPTVLEWDGAFSVPWLIGLLSLLCLAVTTCVTTTLLRIRGRVGCVLAAALLAGFPTATATFSYMFTADAYFFALMLAALAAYVVARHPFAGIPLGCVALIASLGIYQSYFPVAAALMVGALLFDCLEGRDGLGRIFLRGVRMLVVLGVSVVCYMALAKIATAKLGGLTDYMGISEMGHISYADLPALILKCYTHYANLFWQNDNGFYFGFLKPLLFLAIVMGVLLLLVTITRRGLSVGHAVLALVLAGLYPLAANCIHVMVAGGDVHDLMVYGALFVLLLPLGLIDFASAYTAELGGARNVLQVAMSWFIVVVLALTAYSYAVGDNKAYLKMDVVKSQLTAYSNRLLSAVEQTEGYTPGMPLVLIGNTQKEPALTTLTPELEDLYLVGVLNTASMRAQYSYGEFLTQYMAYPGEVCVRNSANDDRQAIAKQYEKLPEVANMAIYPAKDSIKIIDGRIVVKLNEP